MYNLIELFKEQNKLFLFHIIAIVIFAIIYYKVAQIKGTKKDKENFANFQDSLYYTTITHFTVGFGDISPESSLMRKLTMAQVLVAFSLMNR